MATSGVQLRKALFSDEVATRKAARQPARNIAPTVDETPSAPPEAAAVREPGLFAIGVALAGVLWERFWARMERTATPADPRYGFADYALGLSLCLAMVVQFCWTAQRDGAPGFWGVYQLLNPIALPAFMATCGLMARRMPLLDVTSWVVRAAPFALAIGVWAAFQIASTWIAAPRGTMTVATAWKSLGFMTAEIPLLLIVPAFMLLIGKLRHHHWFMLALAILAEALVIPGRTFGGECMRGLVYFQLGYMWAPRLRVMAREAVLDAQMAVCAIAVWLALAGVCAFIRIPYAGNATVVTLPFASLGLGVAGALALVMGAALLEHFRLFEALGRIGRNWIVAALTVPLALQGGRALLIATHAAPNPAAADLVISVTALAAFVAMVGVAAAQFAPQLRGTQSRTLANQP